MNDFEGLTTTNSNRKQNFVKTFPGDKKREIFGRKFHFYGRDICFNFSAKIKAISIQFIF